MPIRRVTAAVSILLLALSVGGLLVGREPKEKKALETIGELPGAEAYSADLKARLAKALAELGPNYRPRTRHLRADGSPKYTNRLILESSPYLFQHAHNPVDWFPWGVEAFERAESEGKPVLLSVGYSTCHWCHVMEEESFEDEEIAAYLNRNYVCIKVDREVRPDIDGIYMAAVQMITGGGGWPMTVWLTPDRRPFYGGTYFPPRDGDRGSRIGFLTVLKTLRDVYDKEGEKVERAASELAQRIGESLAPRLGETELSARWLDEGFRYFERNFDERFGGFGGAPKFPRSVALEFLLRYHRRTGNPRALEMVAKTLEGMASGGMYDQVGGGFHRYSTDAQWLVPHFEKMLYDNAQLVIAYLEAYQASGREDFAAVARDILRYVAREMTSAERGFYSAADADSEGGEGAYFLWTPAQIEEAVGARLAEVVKTVYGITEEGNFEGKSLPYLALGWREAARRLGTDEATLRGMVEEARDLLYRARLRRRPPATDTKILTAWNGLMIGAFARAGLVLGDPALIERAVAAARFVLSRLAHDGRLMRSFKDGRATQGGYLDDYAFLIWGLLELYESSSDFAWLERALELQASQDREFWDEEAGGYFLTGGEEQDLLAREKPDYDGAEPSGNSVAALNLLRLSEFTGDDRLRERADRCLEAFSAVMARAPAAVPKMLVALDFRMDKPKEIVIVKPAADASADHLLAKIRTSFVPNRVLTVVTEQEISAGERLVPLLEGKKALGGKTTAYVCKGRVCDLPTSDPEVFAQQLSG